MLTGFREGSWSFGSVKKSLEIGIASKYRTGSDQTELIINSFPLR